MIRIVAENPPLFDEINARFKIAGHNVIFAWGDRIYNPKRIVIPPEIMLHEQVHMERQATDIEGWWRRYIADDAFRLDEEVLAHRAEFAALVRQHGGDRNTRRRCLNFVGLKLCSPVYGRMVALHEAKKLIAA